MALQHTASAAEREAYIRMAARMRGIDPDVAVRVAKSEGFNTYVGDQGRSFGDWQLFTGGGLGNEALQRGIDVRDPGTWRQQTDFALDKAAQGGWGPWYGAAKVGVDKMEGIGGAPVPSMAQTGGVPQSGPASINVPPLLGGVVETPQSSPPPQSPAPAAPISVAGAPQAPAMTDMPTGIFGAINDETQKKPGGLLSQLPGASGGVKAPMPPMAPTPGGSPGGLSLAEAIQLYMKNRGPF